MQTSRLLPVPGPGRPTARRRIMGAAPECPSGRYGRA
jgi:hypothetical protein